MALRLIYAMFSKLLGWMVLRTHVVPRTLSRLLTIAFAADGVEEPAALPG